MPFLTTTGGLNFSYPTDGTTNWGSTLKTSFNTISAHNHTGAPNGVQLGTNSLQNNAITETKFRLTNDSFLRGRNAADSADINILKVTTGDALQFGNGTSNATISATNITLSGSGTISSSGPFVFPAGTVSAPSVTFTGDTNTGFYNIAADTIGAATNGVERVRVDTAAVTSTLPVVHPAGTAGAPSLTFASDLNTGFYQIAGDTIGAATNGVERVRVDTAAVTSTLPYVAPAGTVSAPSLTFASDLNTGFYQIAADTIGIATAGSERARVTSDGVFHIGTGTPNTAAAGYRLHVNDSSTTADRRIQLGSGGYTLDLIRNGQSGSIVRSIGGTLYLQTLNAHTIQFDTNNTYRAQILSTGEFLVPGVYTTIVGGTNRDVFVDSNGYIGYVTSIRDSKTEIQDLTDISWLYQLNPVSFKYRKRDENGVYTDETDGDIQYGMIAEDVQPIRPDLCFYDEVDGQQELRGIQYSKLTAVLLKAVQDLKAEIETLKAQVTPQ